MARASGILGDCALDVGGDEPSFGSLDAGDARLGVEYDVTEEDCDSRRVRSAAVSGEPVSLIMPVLSVSTTIVD